MAARHFTSIPCWVGFRRYADRLCRHPMPTTYADTLSDKSGKRTLLRVILNPQSRTQVGGASEGLPTSYADNLCRQPMPTSLAKGPLSVRKPYLFS